MAQQKKKGQGKRVPQYSGNSITLRYVCGLALLALGGLMMLSLVLDMDGAVFQFMRAITRGAGGVLAPLLPVVPMWGGVVLLISVQRQAPVRPWILFVICYLLVSAGLTLATATMGTTGTVSLMDYLAVDNANRYVNPQDYEVFLARGFELGRDRNLGGGLMGMLLAWPLWRAFGAIGGCVAAFVLAVGDALLLFRVNFGQIGQQLRVRQAEKQQRQAQQQAEQRERELQWQMEQAYRQQQQQQQQQQYAQQQQARQQQKRQRQQRTQQPAPVYAGSGIGFQPAADEQYVQVNTDIPAQQEAYTSALETQRQQRKQSRPRKQKPAQGPAPYAMQGAADSGQRANERPQPVETPVQQPAAVHYGAPDRVGYEWRNPAVQEPNAQAAPAAQPAPAQPETADSTTQPASYFAQGRRAAAASATVEPQQEKKTKSPWQKALQKKQAEIRGEAAEPAPAYDDTPPWEEAPAMVVPKVQQQPPRETWQPELHLPPRKHPVDQGEEPEPERRPYVFPPMTLLKEPMPYDNTAYQEDEERSRQLEKTLENHGIPAEVMHVTHGPTLSRFEILVGEKTTVERVVGLRRTLASRMATSSVRIEAIPETQLIGVEIPNRKRQTVTLREVLDSPEMRSNKSPLAVALGRDIAGVPIICELNKMPHMLVAGMTGGGKSVCVHSIIHSILYRTTPDEVRLILFDPKMNEMVHYEDLPHLLLPVVTSPQKVAAVLDWAVAEMMRRYQLLRDNKVPKIDEYNAKLPAGEKRLPYIVIVIDEMTDLMMTCGKEVEASVQRLAQLARAAGIHLLLATQNPVREIITGKIKANIPARVAFKTSEQVDSRVILNSVGAESLLGKGDMIFKSDTGSVRVQGCFLSTEEMEATTNFIRANNMPDYDPDVMDQLDKAESDGTPSIPGVVATQSQQSSGNDDAAMLRRAIEIAVQDGQISTTYLQRQLKLGFGRAGRITDEMEKRGIISAKDGAKPRRCLISLEEYEMLKETLPKDGEPLD